jgi:hypothetical protein
METWEINENADEKARYQLAAEMTMIGVYDAVAIWPDEGRAYLDTANLENYHKVAQHFNAMYDGEDRTPVDDALLKRYNELFEAAREQLAE